jgi:hypothetical protein
MTRTILKTEYKTRKEVLQEILNLNDTFKRAFKRNPKSDLIYAEFGTVKNPKFELAIYCETQDNAEMEFFKEQLTINISKK